MWTIRLENLSGNADAFDKLKPFADDTDLLLNGYGQYVSNDVTVCNKKLNDYYQEDETISKLNVLSSLTPRF